MASAAAANNKKHKLQDFRGPSGSFISNNASFHVAPAVETGRSSPARRSIFGRFTAARSRRAAATDAIRGVEWPDPKDVLLSRKFHKLCPGNVWAERMLLVTSKYLHITRDSAIAETILLSSVVRVCSPLADFERENSHFNMIEHSHEAGGSLPGGEDLEERRRLFPLGVPEDIAGTSATAHVNVPSMVTLVTEPEGLGKQIPIHFKVTGVDNIDEIGNWVKQLVDILKVNLEKDIKRRQFEKVQRRSKDLFERPLTRWLFALLIFASYMSDVLSAQYLPTQGSSFYAALMALEYVFTFLFLFELAWNLFSNWLYPFLSDGWSLFDCLVVSVSVMSLFISEGSDGLKSVRLVRVLRAMRLVARFESLRKIVRPAPSLPHPSLSHSLSSCSSFPLPAIGWVLLFPPKMLLDNGMSCMIAGTTRSCCHGPP